MFPQMSINPTTLARTYLPATVIIHRKICTGCVIMSQKKIERLAEEFLWANSGDAVGVYAGGRRVARKMPWNKIMKVKI